MSKTKLVRMLDLDAYVLIAEAAHYYLVGFNVARQRSLMILLPSIISLQLRPE